MDGTDERQAIGSHFRREGAHLEKYDEGEAETLTPEERQAQADECNRIADLYEDRPE